MHHLKDDHYDPGHILWLFFIILWMPIRSHAIELDDYDLSNDEITYISPTRLKQSPHDIPASVSRITQKTISKLQLNSLPEVFRYIAGMRAVKFLGGYDVNYHHTDTENSSRLLLLIDGVPIQYSFFYALKPWSMLPITINDLDYIEVTRSSGAATYGISSLMAMINIVTKKPLTSPALTANITKGGNNYQHLDLSLSGKPSTRFSYRISAAASNDDGFDEFSINSKISIVNSTANFKINQSTHGSISFYYGDSENYRPDSRADLVNIEDETLKTKNQYFLSKINHAISPYHDIQLKTYHTRIKRTDYDVFCQATFLFSEPLSQLSFQNPDYADKVAFAVYERDPERVARTGVPEEDALRDQFIVEGNNYFDELYETSTCGVTNANTLEKNFTVELEDTYIFSENLRLVSGVGVNREHIDSMRYLQGNTSSTTYRLFASAETRWNQWVFNTGTMLVHNDEVPDDSTFSPRLGANYRLNNDSTLRFILSKAILIPSLSERELDLRIYVENFTMPYPADERTEGYRAFGIKYSGNLESEELLAREISLYTKKRYPSDNGTIDIISDIKLFYNSLSFRPYSITDNYGNDKVGNTRNTTLKGFETDMNISFNNLFGDTLENLDFHINYTYLDSDTGNFLENSKYTDESQAFLNGDRFIRHAGSMYSIFDFKDGWFTTLSYSGSITKASSFSTYEFGFGKEIKLAAGSLTLSGKLSRQKRPDDVAINDSPNAFFFNARLEL